MHKVIRRILGFVTQATAAPAPLNWDLFKVSKEDQDWWELEVLEELGNYYTEEVEVTCPSCGIVETRYRISTGNDYENLCVDCAEEHDETLERLVVEITLK